uniref:Uncharacterized protein n=1 Tax=Calonectria ilicicola TaxID=182845 RepID=A0A6G7MY35_9HYPO|nr:hypothetical protein HGG39_mgp06 [Calonectria ilicicola]QIJ45876.1 hypothetical protein [Calonectria ilicicola]QIJ45883.1 hypothetical protein [Calonectria ilicicola]QIJ45975.1 hypothetical protein [Calonectria ilicicola]QIQ23098.1 hypothetical protein [Calonectria ilicicola]
MLNLYLKLQSAIKYLNQDIPRPHSFVTLPLQSSCASLIEVADVCMIVNDYLLPRLADAIMHWNNIFASSGDEWEAVRQNGTWIISCDPTLVDDRQEIVGRVVTSKILEIIEARSNYIDKSLNECEMYLEPRVRQFQQHQGLLSAVDELRNTKAALMDLQHSN